jgi:hypothetical protein
MSGSSKSSGPENKITGHLIAIIMIVKLKDIIPVFQDEKEKLLSTIIP